MVTEWGMSDRIGPMNVGDRGDEIFLGREIVERRDVSDQMAQQVDEEVRKLLDDAYDVATKVISENQDKLHALAKALLERETLDADEINAVFEGRELPPLPTTDPVTDAERPAAKPAKESAAATQEAAARNLKLKPAASFESTQGEATEPETSR